MATGEDIVALARSKLGQAYENVFVPKTNPNWSGPWDCAELVSWCVYQVSGIIYGCRPTTPSRADAYTGYWYDDARNRGRIVTVDEAAAIPGAAVLRPPPGPGEMGHIVISTGDGGTVEARGRRYGVVEYTLQNRNWIFGVLVPEVAYSRGSGGGRIEPARFGYRLAEPMMHGPAVRAIQEALLANGFHPGPIDGWFGELTAKAVFAFQRASGLVHDGEVGPETAAALGLDQDILVRN